MGTSSARVRMTATGPLRLCLLFSVLLSMLLSSSAMASGAQNSATTVARLDSLARSENSDTDSELRRETEADSPSTDSAELLREANSAFQTGDYGLAARRYRAILESGIVNEDLLFNLGTAELRAGRRGHAILAFERALRLSPNDEDVAFNLNEARRGNIDRVVGEREETPILVRLGEKLPTEPLGIAFAVTWPLAFVALALGRWRHRLRTLFGNTAILCGLVAVSCALALGVAAFAQSRGVDAIVVATSAPVREGPADAFKISFELHEGSKVRVVGEDTGYVRIRLSNGLEGWVKEAQVPAI